MLLKTKANGLKGQNIIYLYRPPLLTSAIISSDDAKDDDGGGDDDDRGIEVIEYGLL